MKERKKARQFLLQAIYQWQLTAADLPAIKAQFLEPLEKKKADIPYFQEGLLGVAENLEAIDQAFEPFLSRPKGDLNPIELALLRLSTYELKFRIDIPFQVVINEALELAKTFGGEDSHKFINGVLDKTAKKLRENEML